MRTRDNLVMSWNRERLERMASVQMPFLDLPKAPIWNDGISFKCSYIFSECPYEILQIRFWNDLNCFSLRTTSLDFQVTPSQRVPSRTILPSSEAKSEKAKANSILSLLIIILIFQKFQSHCHILFIETLFFFAVAFSSPQKESMIPVSE